MKKVIEICPREKIRFVSKIAYHFVSQVFGIDDMLLTDWSSIADFKPFGYKSGDYERVGDKYRVSFFTYSNKDAIEKFGKNFFHLNEEQREQIKEKKTMILSRFEMYFDEDIVSRTYKVYGVDISEMLDKKIYEVALYISQNMGKKKRKELFG